MIFQVKDLITKLDQRMAAVVKEATEYAARIAAEQEEALAAWQREEAPLLASLADYIKEVLNSGKPLTPGHISKWRRSVSLERQRYGGYFSELGITLWGERNAPKPLNVEQVLEPLRAARELLSIVKSETVTTNALREIGLRDVGKLFRS